MMMRHRIIRALRGAEPEGLTTSEVRAALGCADKRTVQKIGGTIGALNDKGLIEKISGRWRVVDGAPYQGGLF